MLPNFKDLKCEVGLRKVKCIASLIKIKMINFCSDCKIFRN